MKKTVILLLALSLMTICVHVASADFAIVDSGNEQHGLSLRDSDGTASPYFYYDGAVVSVLENLGVLSLVSIGDDRVRVEGHLETDCLRGPLDTKGKSAIMVAEVASSIGGEAALFEGPYSNPLILGMLYNGARVEVVGEKDNLYHVRIGDRHGFMEKGSLKLTNEYIEPDMDAGLPIIGYVFFDPNPEISLAMHEFPSDDSATVDHPWLSVPSDMRPAEYPIYLLADLGDWYQVKIQNNDIYHGFIKASSFDRKILLNDWIIDESREVASGGYTVGRDLQAGLYTYTLAQGESGVLNIEGSGMPYDKEFNATGPASYTLYLPEGTKVEWYGEGMMSTTSSDQMLFVNGELPYREGVFFAPYAFPKVSRGSTSVTYDFPLVDGCGDGYAIVYGVVGEKIDLINLPENSIHERSVESIWPSDFIETHNCTIRITLYDNNYR